MAISPGEEDAPTLDAWLGGVAGAGLEAVQVRRKASDDVTVLGEVRRARAALGEPVAVLLNGRADLAAVAGADGVHLPAAGVPAAVVRHCLEPHALIGRSTHALEEVEAAAEERVDYVTFGPVFATPSKVRFGSPVTNSTSRSPAPWK